MILTALFLLQAGAQAPVPDANCADPATQTALNICSYEDLREADAALNEQWARATAVADKMDRRSAEYDGPDDHHARLLEAQRNWLVYRDAHCLAVSGLRTETSGTIWPLIQNNCMEDLTFARTELLRQYADQPN